MDTYTLFMLIILGLVFYFMLIRPEQKRKKEAQQLRDSLKKGDKVTTIGGIVGTIVNVGPGTIVIETSEDRVRMELTKWAVSTTGVQTGEEEPNKKKDKKKKKDSAQVPEEPKAPEVPEAPKAEEPKAAEEEKKD